MAQSKKGKTGSAKRAKQQPKPELSAEELDGVVGGATLTEVNLADPRPDPVLDPSLDSLAQRWIVGRWTVK